MNVATDAPRLVPHSIEAEQSVLGAVLLDNAALTVARKLLSATDFYRGNHQAIYQAMLHISEHNEVIDNITLSDALQSRGLLANVGGATYLAELVATVASAANVAHHARIVAEKARLRTLRVQLMAAQTAIENGEDGERLTVLIDGMKQNAMHAYKSDPPHESHFHPVSTDQLLAEAPEDVSWVHDEYLPAGGLVALIGKPKEGKSTLAYEWVVKVSKGLPFLGRQTRQVAVLILAVEEHGRDVRMRLRNLGASGPDSVFVHVGPLNPTATVFAKVTSFVREHGVRLILIDTLSSFWRIENENDAAEMTKAMKPLLQLARDSGACVLLIHHARKSEGSYGDEIRGSGALFAAVDVALIMKRHEVQTQRLIQAQSRYPETPSELVLELRESGYASLGDPALVGKAARLVKLTESLTDQWEEIDTIVKRAGLSQREGHRLLSLLVEEEKALRDGKGRKGSPYLFKRNSIHAGGQSIGHESNSTKADSIHATPPSPRTNSNEVIDLC
jgi:hypothetical protein